MTPCPVAVVFVGTDTGSEGHDVGNVSLLVYCVEEMRPGPSGENPHIISAVGLLLERNGSREDKGRVSLLVLLQISCSLYSLPGGGGGVLSHLQLLKARAVDIAEQ